jgi:hypothetical protein
MKTMARARMIVPSLIFLACVFAVRTADAQAPAATPPPSSVPTSGTASKAAAPTTTAPKTAGNTDPTGATAKCKDGTYSKSKQHSGACSKHGGVDQWLDGSK